ncbi:MAG TPA: DUF1573 domain-containing protein [Candidatus Alistipes avicola]|uniref:DUF1573 domain-containing protein n=2 Tax=Alistipes TaxID=239759 RepID=A0A9D2IAZ0_9BACT|nr:DUF1573 domain-containing protein [Candidatus Alistipes avicola]
MQIYSKFSFLQNFVHFFHKKPIFVPANKVSCAMFPKRLLLYIFLLTSTLTGFSQPKLVFDEPSWDFGTIRETDGPVFHRFVCRNEGDIPGIILEVTSTCGCTRPEFSRKPIMPGQSGVVTVTYDPTNRPGTFSREVAVFTVDRKIAAKLRVSGEVIGRPKTPQELYPVDCGQGLRIDCEYHSFSNICHGRTTLTEIGYINLSDRPVTLELRPKQASGFLDAEYPRQIAPHEKGVFTFSYTLAQDASYYGTIQEVLELLVNGKPSRKYIYLHGFSVDDPSSVDQEKAPEWQLSKNIITFGPLKRTNIPVKQHITISNTGKSTLKIRAIEAPVGVECSLQPGDGIRPGETRGISVSLDASQQEYGTWSRRIILIANDPLRPVQSIRLTAIIED